MASIDREYDSISGQYDSITDLPLFRIEWQLNSYALGDCTGKTVLDLGGGTGLHARQAIDHGAKFVDNVDISPGMLEDGKSITADLGRSDDAIRWFVGDVSKSLEKLPLHNAYDVVLVGWTFDHAETDEQLQSMWRNVARYLRTGGQLINTRIANITCPAAKSGKYGVQFTDIQEIPGGLAYKYSAATKPVFSCPASTMRASMEFEAAEELAKRNGFTDYKQVPATETELVKNDPEFWQLYTDEPFFVCITATKQG